MKIPVALIALGATSLGCTTMAATRVKGVLGPSAPDTLRITSRGGEAVTVQVNGKTAYMKWATHKPWSGGRISAAALVQGECVEVSITENNIAKLVYVSDEPACSIFDPCRDRR